MNKNTYNQMYRTNRGSINWRTIGAQDPGPNTGPAERFVNHQLRQPNKPNKSTRNSTK